MNEATEKLMQKAYEFSDKAIRLDSKPNLEDFKFIDDYFHKFLVDSERVHQLIGGIISLYFGHKVMTEIMKQTKVESSDIDSSMKYHGEVLPSAVYRKIYTFSSLMGATKDDIERFDKNKPLNRFPDAVSFHYYH
jgi:DNA-binding phage protein